MAFAGMNNQKPIVNLEDEPVLVVNADAPPAGKFAFEWFGLANAVIAVPLNALQKLVDALECFFYRTFASRGTPTTPCRARVYSCMCPLAAIGRATRLGFGPLFVINLDEIVEMVVPLSVFVVIAYVKQLFVVGGGTLSADDERYPLHAYRLRDENSDRARHGHAEAVEERFRLLFHFVVDPEVYLRHCCCSFVTDAGNYTVWILQRQQSAIQFKEQFHERSAA